MGGAEASGNSAAYNVSLTSLVGGSGGVAQSGDLVIVATGLFKHLILILGWHRWLC